MVHHTGSKIEDRRLGYQWYGMSPVLPTWTGKSQFYVVLILVSMGLLSGDELFIRKNLGTYCRRDCG